MSKEKILKLLSSLFIIFCISFSLIVPSYSEQKPKIGIFIFHEGTPEDYRPDWTVQFFNFMFDILNPGFLAGGPLEGNTCYTLIHYANEAEAEICGVDEGTPIDVLCNQYTGSYPIHSLLDHNQDADGNGIMDFDEQCFSPGFPIPLAPLAFGHSTINPAGEKIFGPHVDDPAGAGIGVADFLEMTSFSYMDLHYRLQDYKMPKRKQLLKWWYGNDAPSYPLDTPERSNIKDRLQEMFPQYEFVFRHGWDSYAENIDMYGKPWEWPDSFETALDELINKEQVTTIVAHHSTTGYSNLKQFGHEWYDNTDQGVSAIAGKTYKECVEDISDGVGPATAEEVNTYLQYKPWDKHWKHSFPFVKHLAETKKPTIDIKFCRAYGAFEEFDAAVIETLNYAIDKYKIPKDSALKIIIGQHGLAYGYMNVAACDNYFRYDEEFTSRLLKNINNEFSWSGKLEVVPAPFQFSEGTTYDPPGTNSPFGKIVSIGETIDTSINGKYVNALGEVIDNGTNNFDTIIVVPMYFHEESSDTLYREREDILGNNIFAQGAYARDKLDDDGTKYNTGDIDEDYFTVKVYDGTGWPSTPGCIGDPENCITNPPVYKGSAERPTTVILCGTILGNAHDVGRKNFTESAVKAIAEALEQPDIVDLKFFRAAPRSSAVKLTWITGNETGNKGFNIYRASSADGAYEKVNDQPISSQGGSGSLARYQFIDKDLQNGTKYFYLVEAVKNPVRTRKYGPASTTPRLIWGILPQ